MENGVEPIAGLVRITLAVSLFLFCIAFLFETTNARARTKRGLWWPFAVAQGVQLVLLAAMPFLTGDWPGLAWWGYVLLAPVIFWGLLAYVWVMITISTRWGRGGALVVPFYITWSLLLYFMAWHLLGLGDGTGWHVPMLALGGVTAALRIVLMLKPR